MILNYKTREVSTKEIYNAFDPPLVFVVKSRAPNGWPAMAEALEKSKLKDVSLAIQILQVLCISISDSTEVHSLTTLEKVEDFCQMLKSVEPDLADEIICNLAYNLALDYLKEKKIALSVLERQQELSTNGKGEKVLALE
jgi:hypothetical protein